MEATLEGKVAAVRRQADPDEVRQAVTLLLSIEERHSASAWPKAFAARIDAPGIYTWWVDAEGANALSTGLGLAVQPGLIYGGEAGATDWSGPLPRRPSSTLRSRIRDNHLRGGVSASTFRWTLSAILRVSLPMKLVGPKKFERSSLHGLNDWMRTHLDLAVYSFADRDVLDDLETQVLNQLDPSLNIGKVPTSPIRQPPQ